MRIEWTEAGTEWLDLIGPGPDDSLVRLRLAPGEDGLRVVGVELSAPPSVGHISTRFLRRLGLGDPLEALDWALVHPDVSGLAAGRWRQRLRRPGRAGQSDSFYALWAQRYVAAAESNPTAPIKYLVDAERAEGRYTTPASVAAFINKARKRNLLTATNPGEPGGDLTPKAKKLLGTD